jgi:ABC-type sugar transport system substrate-binding protein
MADEMEFIDNHDDTHAQQEAAERLGKQAGVYGGKLLKAMGEGNAPLQQQREERAEDRIDAFYGQLVAAWCVKVDRLIMQGSTETPPDLEPPAPK